MTALAGDVEALARAAIASPPAAIVAVDATEASCATGSTRSTSSKGRR